MQRIKREELVNVIENVPALFLHLLIHTTLKSEQSRKQTLVREHAFRTGSFFT